ncbi:Uncharacterized protein TCM_034348 [Theobroma cacao]|uniref:Uncharacterized protein n=1 Tax=Theobroma cacao TaxID=3641 RepID=A0A061FEU4_THECC|nr:Uncharacterized protein TCM_034348 [Theobroma cacao]
MFLISPLPALSDNFILFPLSGLFTQANALFLASFSFTQLLFIITSFGLWQMLNRFYLFMYTTGLTKAAQQQKPNKWKKYISDSQLIM